MSNGILNWGVVGTGGIAADFCQALQLSARCRIVNVAGSSPGQGGGFAANGASRVVRRALAAAGGSSVEAVYIATPHPFHEKMAIAAIAAGKQVLCEKPMALDEPGATKVIAAARSQGVFLMEGYMYRGHPLMRELVTRLQDGVYRRSRHVRADFGFRVPREPDRRLFNPALGGGSILDVGGYPMSFARLIAGIVEGRHSRSRPASPPRRNRSDRRRRVRRRAGDFGSGLTASLTMPSP